MSDPRQVAYDVLRAVREDGAYANLALSGALRAHLVSGRDAAFATELAAGTLRMQGSYDAILDHLARRELDPAVRDVLRLGAHQLLGMRVAGHAAVSTSVDLVRRNVGHRPAGFVNALLRKVAGGSFDEWMTLLAPADPVDALALRRSHPRWVVEELRRALGDREGELESLLTADNIPPRVMLVARPGRASIEELVAAGGRATGISPYAVELPGGDPGEIPAIRDGRAAVQDEGSQLVAVATATVALDGRDERWLDMCAGPGGKAALLASLAAERGAGVLSVELQPHRAELVRKALGPDEVGSLGVLVGDATEPLEGEGSFDRVLLDAPCSGLGALRRRPEARWRKSPAEIPGLVSLQERLLRAGLRDVRPGGVVVYSTCTPVLEETAGVVSSVVAGGAAAIVPVSGRDLGVEDASGPLPGTVQLWPHRHNTDAMFLAVLRRQV